MNELQILEGAPAWVTVLFWALLALFAAFSVYRRFVSGSRDETTTIRASGKATSSKTITESTPVFDSHQVAVGRQIVDELSGLRKSVDGIADKMNEPAVVKAIHRVADAGEEMVKEQVIEQRAQQRAEQMVRRGES